MEPKSKAASYTLLKDFNPEIEGTQWVKVDYPRKQVINSEVRMTIEGIINLPEFEGYTIDYLRAVDYKRYFQGRIDMENLKRNGVYETNVENFRKVSFQEPKKAEMKIWDISERLYANENGTVCPDPKYFGSQDFEHMSQVSSSQAKASGIGLASQFQMMNENYDPNIPRQDAFAQDHRRLNKEL